MLEQILRELESRRTGGSGFDLHLRTGSFSTGQGNSLSAARRETTGFRERSSLSTTTDRACRSAAERSAGKDPHKVDKCGALRARQLAKKLVREGVDEARVISGLGAGR